MFLVQGQLLAGSGPSLVGLSAGLLADPERVGRYIASITDQEPGMNGHHLDPQVAGDSHIFDLFSFCFGWQSKTRKCTAVFCFQVGWSFEVKKKTLIRTLEQLKLFDFDILPPSTNHLKTDSLNVCLHNKNKSQVCGLSEVGWWQLLLPRQDRFVLKGSFSYSSPSSTTTASPLYSK